MTSSVIEDFLSEGYHFASIRFIADDQGDQRLFDRPYRVEAGVSTDFLTRCLSFRIDGRHSSPIQYARDHIREAYTSEQPLDVMCYMKLIKTEGDVDEVVIMSVSEQRHI